MEAEKRARKGKIDPFLRSGIAGVSSSFGKINALTTQKQKQKQRQFRGDTNSLTTFSYTGADALRTSPKSSGTRVKEKNASNAASSRPGSAHPAVPTRTRTAAGPFLAATGTKQNFSRPFTAGYRSQVPKRNGSLVDNRLSDSGSAEEDVTITESKRFPGVYIASRSSDFKAKCPERLNLDRRNLKACCLVQGEEQLRLLNYQHNSITRIRYLNNLTNLVFLDMYNNELSEISGLEAAPNLRVLMLGRNNIKMISGIESLKKLDVLDMHNNHVARIEGLSELKALRILNLAGNLITTMQDISDMKMLTELNLRRNALESLILEADEAAEGNKSRNPFPPKLQRLFASYNKIGRSEDIATLTDLSLLREVALDGNPLVSIFQTNQEYREHTLQVCKQVHRLDMRLVSDDERKAAAALVAKQKQSRERAQERRSSEGREESFGEFATDITDTILQLSVSDSSDPTAAPLVKVAQDSDSTRKGRKNFGSTGNNNTFGRSSILGSGSVPRPKAGDETEEVVDPSTSIRSGIVDVQNASKSRQICIKGHESIADIERLCEAVDIETLTLTTVEGPFLRYCILTLGRLPTIRTIVLRDNQICYIRELFPLHAAVGLRHLRIEGANPLLEFIDFRLLITQCFRNLVSINNQNISASERLEAEDIYAPLFCVIQESLLVSPLREDVAKRDDVISGTSEPLGLLVSVHSRNEEYGPSGSLVPDMRVLIHTMDEVSKRSSSVDAKEKANARKKVLAITARATVAVERRRTFDVVWPDAIQSIVQEEIDVYDRRKSAV